MQSLSACCCLPSYTHTTQRHTAAVSNQLSRSVGDVWVFCFGVEIYDDMVRYGMVNVDLYSAIITKVISDMFSPGQSVGLVWKKLNLTQQKQAFTNKKKCTATQNKHAKTKAPGLDAFCDIQSRNAAGLYSEEEKKQTDLTVSV